MDSRYNNPFPQVFGPGFTVVAAVLALIIIIAWWKVFTKAGHPGWACLIPIYNLYILIKIAGKAGLVDRFIFDSGCELCNRHHCSHWSRE